MCIKAATGIMARECAFNKGFVKSIIEPASRYKNHTIYPGLELGMENISTALTRNHRDCDSLIAAAEEAVGKCRWDEADSFFSNFVASMERHLGKEEEVLFPALEQKVGTGMGPVQVMRKEHEDMRRLFGEIREDIAQQQAEHCLGLTDTLLMLMQQHNLKEESILYPMADQMLADEQSEVIAQFIARDGGP